VATSAHQTTVWRSLLFVGNRPGRFAKAQASGAHAVIIDLKTLAAKRICFGGARLAHQASQVCVH
jgi:hypothetical protein